MRPASSSGDVRVDGFTLPGSRPLGCLLVHGFTATPEEMRPLGEALARRGFPVRAVRLPGHGTEVADLAQTGWQDWFAAVADAAATLRCVVPHVALAGMSMGALLGLHLASTRPEAVQALVLCGTPIRLRDLRLRFLPLVTRIPWVMHRFAVIPKAGGPDIADPAVRAASLSYRAMPLPAIVELLRLQAVVQRELRRVTQPALLLHGRHDHSAPVANVDTLRRGLGSRVIEQHILERSWHVITLDYERDRVAELSAAFLDRVEGDLRASSTAP